MKGIIINKIALLSYPCFQKKLFNAINIFLNNGYPLQFIFSTIEKKMLH